MLRSWCRGGRSRHQLSVIIQTPVESCNFFNAFIVQLRYVSSDLMSPPSVWESSDKKTLHAELQADFQEVDSPEMKPAPHWEAAELLPVFLLAPSLWRLQAVRTPRIFSSDYNRVYLPSSQLIHLPASCSARYTRSASVALSTNNRAETETSEERGREQRRQLMMMVKRGRRGDTPDHPGGFWHLMQYRLLAGFCSPQATDQ